MQTWNVSRLQISPPLWTWLDVRCQSVLLFEVYSCPTVSTEAYQAQYRVLEAFSLFNVILGGWLRRVCNVCLILSPCHTVWSFLLFLLAVAVKHHRQGHTNVWTYPVTKYHVFKSQQLPRYNQQTRGRTTTKKSHGDGFLRNASPREDARAKMRHHSRRRDDKSPGPREPSRRPSRVRR